MKTEESNTIIARYDGWVPANYGHATGYWISADYEKRGWTSKQFKYDTSIQWLYPVYLKLRKELMDIQDENAGLNSHRDFLSRQAYSNRSSIEVALIQGDIQELHAEIVKGIKFLNEQKK